MYYRALAMAACIACAAVPDAALARDGLSPGAAVALGALGGVALGGVALGGAIAAQADDGYYPGRRIYAAPPPVYREREVVVVEPRRRVVVEEVVPECHFERRRRVDEYGDVFFRRVRVCE